MKKIFTLVAAALLSASMSAKEIVDLSALFEEGTTNIVFNNYWVWRDIAKLATGDVIENAEEKTADDSGVTYFDASAYDYFCLKYSASTTDVKLIVQQQCLGTVGEYGAQFNEVSAVAPASSKGGFVGVALDKDNADKIFKLALQNPGPAGSITVDEAFWATAEEYEAIKAEQVMYKDFNYKGFSIYDADNDQFVFPAGDAGWYNLWLGDFDFTGYNTLIIEVASCDGDAQFVMYNGGAVGSCMIGKSDEPKSYAISVSELAQQSQFQLVFQNFNFADPTIADWNERIKTAQEMTMKITAMYLTSEIPDMVLDYKKFGGYVAENDNFVFEAGKAGWYGQWFGNLVPGEYKNVVIEVASSTGPVKLRAMGEMNEGASDYVMIGASDQPHTYYFDLTDWTKIEQFAFQNFNFADPTIEDFDEKAATAQETTMKITAMYLTTAEAPAPDEWTVAGDQSLVGVHWDVAATANNMTTEDNINFTYTVKDVTLEKGGIYKFKVVKNHSWDEAYPASDYVLNVTETGVYTVTISFNIDTKAIAVDLQKTGEAEIEEKSYSVIGTIVGNWDVDTAMELDGNVYKAVFSNVAAGKYEFKVRVNSDWKESYPQNNWVLDIAQSGSTVTITFNPDTKEITVDVLAGAVGINAVEAAAVQRTVYNLAGQKVAAQKGVVIANGKKFMNK